MRCVVTMALTGLLLCAAARAQDGVAASYEAMVKKVKSGDMNVDFRAMRMACMAVATCQPRSTTTDLTALTTKDNRRGIAIGEKLLDQGYVNAEVHATVAAHYQKLGTPEGQIKAAFHQGIFTALLQSILSSGDGKSPATAWTTISDREEYIALSILGYPYSGPNVSGGPMERNGHLYKRWQIKTASGVTVNLYFNIDAYKNKSVVAKDKE